MSPAEAEALAALTDARAARNRAEDERDAALTAKTIADVQRDAAEAERDELRAALDNEGGRGAPPSPNWEFVDGLMWERKKAGPIIYATVEPGEISGWTWMCGSRSGLVPTAREGMRAADAARGQP